MSTENTEYNFSKAMSQVAALRAEEPALAWANDYQQPPAVLARAQQLDEEYGKITEKDIEREVQNAVAQYPGISPDDVRNVLRTFLGSSRSQLGELKETATKIAKEMAQEVASKTANSETPQQKIERLQQEIIQLKEDIKALDKDISVLLKDGADLAHLTPKERAEFDKKTPEEQEEILRKRANYLLEHGTPQEKADAAKILSNINAIDDKQDEKKIKEEKLPALQKELEETNAKANLGAQTQNAVISGSNQSDLSLSDVDAKGLLSTKENIKVNPEKASPNILNAFDDLESSAVVTPSVGRKQPSAGTIIS